MASPPLHLSTSPPLQHFGDDTFCCDQSLCLKGESTFLFEGPVSSEEQCAAQCNANAKCAFITLAVEPTQLLCFNCQYCNTTWNFNKKGGGFSVTTYERRVL
jgi:hypothetical protein